MKTPKTQVSVMVSVSNHPSEPAIRQRQRVLGTDKRDMRRHHEHTTWPLNVGRYFEVFVWVISLPKS